MVVYTLRELAKMLKTHEITLQKYCARGRIRAQRVGMRWLVTEANLQDFMNGNGSDVTSYVKRREEIFKGLIVN